MDNSEAKTNAIIIAWFSGMYLEKELSADLIMLGDEEAILDYINEGMKEDYEDGSPAEIWGHIQEGAKKIIGSKRNHSGYAHLKTHILTEHRLSLIEYFS